MKYISGKFSIAAGLLLLVIITAVFVIIKPFLVFASSSVTDSFTDTSKINTGASSHYIVTGGKIISDFNNGLDGAVTISANKNINTDIIAGGRSTYADGVNYVVTAIGTNTITTTSSALGILAMDEIVLVNLQGDYTNFGNVGNYEFLRVTGVNNNVITTSTNIQNIYGATNSNGTLTGQKIMVQRVPNYSSMTVNGGITLTANGYNIATGLGGVLAFRVAGTLTNNGVISMDAKGYAGGPYGPAIADGAYGGDSRCGAGGHPASAGAATPGAGGGGGKNTTAASLGYCGGGGGGFVAAAGSASYGGAGGGGFAAGTNGGGAGAGGGGGYGTGGQGYVNGTTNANGEGASGTGGSSGNGGAGGGGGSYGPSNLSKIFLGSGGAGGGSGWHAANGCGNHYVVTVPGGNGGAGGGIVYIGGQTLTLGSGTITTNGEGGTAPGSNTFNCASPKPGGGASGGSIYLLGNTSSVTLGAGTSAVGGVGSATYVGGSGRIAVQGAASGTTSPTYTSVNNSFPTAVIQSTNLLSGQTELVKLITSFVYNLSSKPTGSTAVVQFSQNASSWYSSAGVLNGSDTLTTGSNNSIALSGLGWSGANFYYKVSLGGSSSSVLDDTTVNFDYHLQSPTIGTPTALSTTSIRWAFTDNASDEVGFKVYDTSNTLKATCATTNLTYCDETGLTAGTSYTRKVAAYDGNGIGTYSGTATKITQSAVPKTPTVTSGTATSLNIDVIPGDAALGTDTYAIYVKPGANVTCDGIGGNYVNTAANSGAPSATAVWQSDASWGTITATGLDLENNTYSICVKGRNLALQETAFGPADDGNGGYISLSGFESQGGAISSKFDDGLNNSRNVYGVDNGSGDNGANTAVFKVSSGTVTILGTDTLVFGSLQVTGGSLIINNGGQLKPGAKLWVVDADTDNYPKKDSNSRVSLYYGSKPTGGRRRTAITTMNVTPDCNDGAGVGANVHVPHSQCYTDADNDGYTNGLKTNAVCLSAATCNGSRYYSAASDGASVTDLTAANKMQDSVASGSDCNDSLSGQNYTLASATYYPDADLDTYTLSGVSAGTAVCSSQSTWNTATSNSVPGAGSVTSNFSAGTRKASANGGPSGADCNDGNSAVYQNINGYADTDGDGYGAGNLTAVCSGAALLAGYSANNTDCGPNNASAHPSSATCTTTSFLNTSSVASYDWNCSAGGGAGTACNGPYYSSIDRCVSNPGAKYCPCNSHFNGTDTVVGCGVAGYLQDAGSTCGAGKCSGTCFAKIGTAGTQACN